MIKKIGYKFEKFEDSLGKNLKKPEFKKEYEKQSKEIGNTLYRTTTFEVACVLITLGYEYRKDKMPNGKYQFIFDESASKVADDYFAGKLSVDPNKYWGIIKNMKTAVKQ